MARVDRRWKTQWDKANPILGNGEIGQDIGSGRIKIGDGVRRWIELSFLPSTTVVDGNADLTGYATEEYVNDAISGIAPPDLSNLATKKYVDDAVAANAGSGGGNIAEDTDGVPYYT